MFEKTSLVELYYSTIYSIETRLKLKVDITYYSWYQLGPLPN